MLGWGLCRCPLLRPTRFGGSARPHGTARGGCCGEVRGARSLPSLPACSRSVHHHLFDHRGAMQQFPPRLGGCPAPPCPAPVRPVCPHTHTPSPPGGFWGSGHRFSRGRSPQQLVPAQNLSPGVVSGEAPLLHPSSPLHPDAPDWGALGPWLLGSGHRRPWSAPPVPPVPPARCPHPALGASPPPGPCSPPGACAPSLEHSSCLAHCGGPPRSMGTPPGLTAAASLAQPLGGLSTALLPSVPSVPWLGRGPGGCSWCQQPARAEPEQLHGQRHSWRHRAAQGTG